jgi:hypothetical protein
MRAEMFRPYKFYNLSFTAWTLDQIETILETISQANVPRIVIVEFDYFMFAPSWPRANRDREMRFFEPLYKAQSGINATRQLAKRIDLLRGCNIAIFSPSQPCGTAPYRYIGMPAISAEEGFRWDGSYRYSDGRLQDARNRYRNAQFLIRSMAGAPHIDPKQLDALQRIVSFAQAHKIILIGLQLPYLGEAVSFLDDDVKYHRLAGLWREFDGNEMRSFAS